MLKAWNRWISRKRSAEGVEHNERTEDQIMAIQTGDDALREAFLAQYRPFIAGSASRFIGRYIDPKHDDEFSIALLAFNEAINSYSRQKGSGFFSFAEKVITRRLMDYARQEQRHTASVPYSALAAGGEESGRKLEQLEYAAALEQFEQEQLAEWRSQEIELLSDQLSQFGIRFEDLADDAPKHQDSRLTMIEIGCKLAAAKDLYAQMLEKRQLPLKELCKLASVSRKTLERNRKYIIAVSLIMGGPYPCLRQYIAPALSGKEGHRQ